MSEPTVVIQDSKYRVAFDLMLRISLANKPTNADPEYWLKLYDSCLTVVTQSGAAAAIQKLPK